jgi:hypothetical protein
LNTFRRESIFFHHDCDLHSGCLDRLFFALDPSIALLQKNPEVIFIDATYNTNKYNLPLLHIAGTTSTNNSFSIAFSFIARETAEFYIWALDRFARLLQILGLPHPRVIVSDRESALAIAVETVFPQAFHMNCLWHLRCNIEAYAIKHGKFSDEKAIEAVVEDWTRLAKSTSQERFDEQWKVMEGRYAARHGQFLTYVRGLCAFRERWCFAWTAEYRHLGNTTDSRLEGLHRTVKRQLNGPRGTLFTVYQAIRLSVQLQFNQIKRSMARDGIFILTQLAGKRFIQRCHRQISRYALTEFSKQWEIFKNASDKQPLSVCTHRFTKGWGIPCAHEIDRRIKLGLQFTPDDFDSHWHVDSEFRPPPRPFIDVQEPAICPRTTTKRLPTALELARKKINDARPAGSSRRPPTCSSCKSVGHNNRSLKCPKNNVYTGGDM